MVNRLRIASGLVLFVFLIGHLSNLSLGLISFQALGVGQEYLMKPWRTLPGTVIFWTAIAIHAGIGLRALFVRRTLRLRRAEMAQLVLGLAIPLMLAGHFIALRLLPEFHDVEVNFELAFAAYWIFFPVRGVLQAVVLVVAWTHGCIGMHMWLRLRPWYGRLAPTAFAIAVALPTLALAGYVATGIQTLALAGDEAWIGQMMATTGYLPEMSDFASSMEDRFQIAFVSVLAAIVLARYLRARAAARQGTAQILYRGRDAIDFKPGSTLLEVLWANSVPHAAVCGGRGRCSTCRVRVGRGADWLDPPLELEKSVLQRIMAPPGVRLACQIRPRVDLEVTPLLPPRATAADGIPNSEQLRGQERDVAIVFVDLRGSTKLSEARLPYDFVFILNQFFAEIAAALAETDGHYAQFNGDGLMAIYGLETGLAEGRGAAIRGAVSMFQRIDALSGHLQGEVRDGLRIGVGIHSGVAIVGTMGPPEHPILSAIGDNVNIAARLESQTKTAGVPLIVSAATAHHAGIDLSAFPKDQVTVRGHTEPLDIHVIAEPAAIPLESPPQE